MRISAADARAALQAALETQNPALIAAARLALASAEDGEDESVDGKRAKKMKKAEAEEEAEEEEEAEAEEYPEGEGEPDGDEEPEGEEAEEEEEASKMKKPFGKAASADVSRLLAALGAKSMSEAIGRAAAASEAMATVDALSKRVKRMEQDKKSAKVDRMFASAQRDGRVTRAEVSHLKAAYKGRPVAELEAYLAAKPRVANPDFAQETAAHYPSAPVSGGVNFTTPHASKAIAAFGVTPEQVAERAAARGMTIAFPGGSK